MPCLLQDQLREFRPVRQGSGPGRACGDVLYEIHEFLNQGTAGVESNENDAGHAATDWEKEGVLI
jgi:hypothetical protein